MMALPHGFLISGCSFSLNGGSPHSWSSMHGLLLLGSGVMSFGRWMLRAEGRSEWKEPLSTSWRIWSKLSNE